jgi:hypothetical protein
MHAIYSRCPNEDIETDFPIEAVLELARGYEKRFSRHE